LTRFDDIGGQVEIELGYRLAGAFWGRGLATEADRAVGDYAPGVLGLPGLVAIINPGNRASIRVAQKRGLRYEKDVIFRQNVCILSVVYQGDVGQPGNGFPPTWGSNLP
jgi:RimJ/RimL family protein N-acetyltransferase